MSVHEVRLMARVGATKPQKRVSRTIETIVTPVMDGSVRELKRTDRAGLESIDVVIDSAQKFKSSASIVSEVSLATAVVKQDLENLEEKMKEMGLEALEQKMDQIVVTRKKIDRLTQEMQLLNSQMTEIESKQKDAVYAKYCREQYKRRVRTIRDEITTLSPELVVMTQEVAYIQERLVQFEKDEERRQDEVLRLGEENAKRMNQLLQENQRRHNVVLLDQGATRSPSLELAPAKYPFYALRGQDSMRTTDNTNDRSVAVTLATAEPMDPDSIEACCKQTCFMDF